MTFLIPYKAITNNLITIYKKQIIGKTIIINVPKLIKNLKAKDCLSFSFSSKFPTFKDKKPDAKQ
jgi:hypothetical protein